MGTLYRSQILLEPEQHQALATIARRDGRSISEVVREIVAQYLATQEQRQRVERQLEALAALTKLRLEIERRHGVIDRDWLAEARAERDEEMDRVLRGEA